jgi:hypothetical protein
MQHGATMSDESGITLVIARAQLATWLAADAAVAAGQSYRFDSGGNSRQITYVDAAEITNKINYWQTQVTRLTSGSGCRVRGVTLL